MNRAYEVRLERGEKLTTVFTFLVVAHSDEHAIRKAKTRARHASGFKTGWRCVALRERRTELLA